MQLVIEIHDYYRPWNKLNSQIKADIKKKNNDLREKDNVKIDTRKS